MFMLIPLILKLSISEYALILLQKQSEAIKPQRPGHVKVCRRQQGIINVNKTPCFVLFIDHMQR